MNEGKEIRFIDLFSGVAGFRRGLEEANKEIWDGLQSVNSRGVSPDASSGELRQIVAGRVQSKNTPHSSEIGLERASRPLDVEARCGKGVGDSGGRGESLVERGRGRTQQGSRLNYRCVWSCDNNKYANQVYTKQFGEENHYSGDIRGVDPGDIPDFDLLCAGFPCQSFSVAGKGQGFQDTRGTLFFEISRIAEVKRPQTLLLENVKGLLSNDRGQTFQTILQELGRIGYWAEWQVFNSKHHGVPQNRERVFIIGHLRKGRSRAIFPIGETDEVAKRKSRGRSPVQIEVSTAIDGNYYKGVDRHGQRTVVLDTFNRGGVKEGEAYSLKTNPSPTSSAVVAVLTPDRAEKSQHGRRFKEEGEPAFTLTGQDIHGVAISFTNPHDSEEERKVNLSDTSRAVKPPYGNQQPLVIADRTRTLAGKGRNLESPKPITNALSGIMKDNLVVEPQPVILHNIYGGFKEGIRTFEEHSPTIRTAKGGGHLPSVLQDFRIRRLTPVECERLQNFPDEWTAKGICKKGDIVWTGKYRIRVEVDEDGFEVTRYRPIMTKAKVDGIYPISDTQRYRALGNAVTTSVITFLGRRIMEAMGVDILDRKSIEAKLGVS